MSKHFIIKFANSASQENWRLPRAGQNVRENLFTAPAQCLWAGITKFRITFALAESL
jgi:hypothetical protein